MRKQTFIHLDNTEIVEAFKAAGATLSQVLNDHFVSNWTLKDVQSRSDLDPTLKPVKVDPVVTEGPDPVVGPIEFDSAVDVIQEIDQAWFKRFREQHGSLFKAADPEPEPELRYKGADPRRPLTISEFVRKVLKKEEVSSWGMLLGHDAVTTAEVLITLSGDIWVGHPDFIATVDKGAEDGHWSEERAAEIKKGLLIT